MTARRWRAIAVSAVAAGRSERGGGRPRRIRRPRRAGQRWLVRRPQSPQRDLLHRRRHGRLDGDRHARLFRRRRRPARPRPVSAHGALAHLLGRFDHAGQRADHDRDDDRGQHQPERASVSTRPPSPTTSTATATGSGLDAARARQGPRDEGRRRVAPRDHARHARRHLRAHQSAQQRERHRASRRCRPIRPTTTGSAAESTF